MKTEQVIASSFGLHVANTNIYIDPVRKVDIAIITHGHSDHVCRGSGLYYATPTTARILTSRYDIKSIVPIDFHQPFEIEGIRFSFHPAGHIPGSAQVRVENEEEVTVVTGDFKRAVDRLCHDFEVVTCDTFIMESTFAQPVYHWPSVGYLEDQFRHWWLANQAADALSVVLGYSLGKAQRLVNMIDNPPGSIYVHKTIAENNHVIEASGYTLNKWNLWDENTSKDELIGSLLITTPSSLKSDLIEDWPPYSIATASGWNQLSNRQYHRTYPMVISDHADWEGLLQTVRDVGANRVRTMHGYAEYLSTHLRNQFKIDAKPLPSFNTI